MADAIAYKEAEIQLTVVRCGCGDPSSHPNQICPKPQGTHDLGKVAYISRNIFKRIYWMLFEKPKSILRIKKINRSL